MCIDREKKEVNISTVLKPNYSSQTIYPRYPEIWLNPQLFKAFFLRICCLRRRRRHPPPLQIMPLFLDGNHLAQLPRPLTPLSQLLERFLLQHAPPGVLVNDPPLGVGQVGPREDGADGDKGAKEQKDESLPIDGGVGRVDAVHDEEGHDATQLSGGGGDAVAGAAVTGWEDFRRDDEG